MPDYDSILASLAAADRPEDICAQFGVSMVELIEFAARPEIAEFLDKAHAFHARQRAMRQDRHAALALDALMEIGLNDTPPENALEARHRAIRCRALACVVSGGARGRGRVDSAHRGPRAPTRETPDESGGARGRSSTADRSSLKAGGDRPAQCDCARNTCLAQSCEAWHQRRTGGVVRPEGEPRGSGCADDRARHVLLADAASSTPPGAAAGVPSWPSAGASNDGARSDPVARSEFSAANTFAPPARTVRTPTPTAAPSPARSKRPSWPRSRDEPGSGARPVPRRDMNCARAGPIRPP